MRCRIFSSKNNVARPDEAGSDEMRKSYSTQHVYEGYLKKWILPRWRSCRLEEVKAVKVEQWLRSLPLARGSKATIRNIMSALYSHAIRWEWIRHNPIRAVRQSAKRSSVPTILLIEQIQSLLKHLQEPCCTAVLLDAATGLRVGELLGLKWEDVDFEKLEINVTRSVVKQRIGPCKTEASRKPIPLDAELAHALWKWKSETVYNQPHDWVFAALTRMANSLIGPALCTEHTWSQH
jgi:integrase